MYYKKFSPFALGAFCLLSGKVAAGRAGGIAATCKDFTVDNYAKSQWLVAKCLDIAGYYRAATIDLGHCFGFTEDDGLYFDPGRNDLFPSQCATGMQMRGSSMGYSCIMPGGYGKHHFWTSLDLNHYISNLNGKLACY